MSTWDNEITKPFANTGDKKDINLEESPDNSISYEKGFTSDYEVQESNGEIIPSKYNINRKEVNQLFYKIFSAIQELQTKSSYKDGYNKANMAKQSTILDLIPGTFSIGSIGEEKIADLNSRKYLFSGYHKIDIASANSLEFTYKNLPKEFEEKYNSGFLQVYTLHEDIFNYPQIKNNHRNTYYIQQNLFPTGKIEDIGKFLYSIPNTLSYYSRILCVEYTNDDSDDGVGSIVVKEESSIDWKKVTLSKEDLNGLVSTEFNPIYINEDSTYNSIDEIMEEGFYFINKKSLLSEEVPRPFVLKVYKNSYTIGKQESSYIIQAKDSIFSLFLNRNSIERRIYFQNSWQAWTSGRITINELLTSNNIIPNSEKLLCTAFDSKQNIEVFKEVEIKSIMPTTMYRTNLGTWTETIIKDSDFKLLEGYNIDISLTEGSITITLPKLVHEHICCIPTYKNQQTQPLSFSYNGFDSITINGEPNAIIDWYYKGMII